MSRIFDTKNIILAKVQKEDLNSFLVDMDIDDQGQPLYQLDGLTRAIINIIPEYVYAHYTNPEIPQTEWVEKLRQAAKSIYKIKDFELMRRWYIDGDQNAFNALNNSSNNRGEFGELILHLLLRDFKSTIPLVSKVYFKDAAGVPAHGFDAVHITSEEQILWLGESKFYSDSKQGLRELLKDLTNHFKADYLEEQFTVIKKNLNVNEIPQREEWIGKLNECNKLKDRIRMINIPMLCTYPHDIYSLHSDLNCDDAINYHEANVRELKTYFDTQNNHPLRNQLNIILLLLPIRDKHELVRKLHERLWHMQNM
ncbi:HamA C-terminal domain-containing protein [Desulfitobacterium chlororespirans]|uniref:Anti-bacteriophage protein A/HamA C-terminal domain-containing protein n=1 Tax=Desulfitobacterium chlororespirans DSM 11544 TaxID=1121395 RepID=A0A1M7RWZ7_9FIRM|nr:DUF1837 domain-containing protein [Desulfitobacterium chlororespirans]SHN50658.1 protein of unknown function [Desulfitobacterium chlororespirans DSM 11544]